MTLRHQPSSTDVPMRLIGFTVVLAVFLTLAPLVTEAQPPIRIGATPSQTGVYAAPGQNQLRGYQLCVEHTNDKGGVLGRKLELVDVAERLHSASPKESGSLTNSANEVIVTSNVPEQRVTTCAGAVQP